MTIVSITSLVLFLALAFYVARRRPVVMIAGFFIIFPMIYRAIDITYLDVFGPIYARELNTFVGGNTAAPMFIYACCAFIFPALWLFPDRGRRLAQLAEERPPWAPYHQTITTASLLLALLVMGALAVNFVRVEAIPILQGIDRLQYNQMAGAVHNTAYELNFLFNFALGAFTVLPRLNGRDLDLRFAGIMVALLMYWIVTGNRYSAFLVLLAFYFMPLAAVMLAAKAGRIGPEAIQSVVQRILTSRTTRAVGVLAAIAMLAGLIVNSYYNVRNYREPLQEIQERILVQPVQLWATAWDRADFTKFNELINDYAVNEIILNPIDATRSSTIQYLMTIELGYFRSAELAELGQAYNGGYPEVHFELFGAWLPLLTLPAAGIIAVLFLRMCILLLYRNMIWSSILGIYLYFGITLHYAGGMVTFFMAPTYWLKIALFLAAWIFESQTLKRAKRLHALDVERAAVWTPAANQAPRLLAQ